MSMHRCRRLYGIMAILLACASSVALADRPPSDKWQKKTYVLDRRHYHDRYYPPRGHIIRHLPRHYHVVPHRSSRYYFHAGIWYRPSGSHFVVSIPPVGLMVPFLPPYYTTVWVGSAPCYYAGGVYYSWQPHSQSYVVTEPPDSANVAVEASESEELFIYPSKDQSEEQQASDRYECHRWALGETGFDPTKPGGNVPNGEYTRKHSDYQRALRACLEARGYSVK